MLLLLKVYKRTVTVYLCYESKVSVMVLYKLYTVINSTIVADTKHLINSVYITFGGHQSLQCLANVVL